MRTIILILFLFVKTVYSQTAWIESNIGTARLTSINFINVQTGFAFSWSYNLYKTTDGGETWQTYQTPSYALSGNFLDDQTGILIGHYPFMTNDGGETWEYGGGIEPVPGSTFATIIMRKGLILNKDTAFVCGNEFGQYGFPPQFYVSGKIYRTTNAGKIWELVYLGGVDFTDIKIDEVNKIYAIRTGLITSSNFGANWNYITAIGTFAPSISQIFGDTMYVSGSSGRIGKSFNGGYNWSLHQTQTGDTLNSVFFIDNKIGWVCGDSGYILHTTNAGTDWIKQETGTTKDIKSIYFINQDTGFAVGDSGLLLKTYTGGTVKMTNISTAVPELYTLYQNYPNPFNPITNIKFDIKNFGNVTVQIFDALGRQISTVIDESLSPGTYSVSFDGSSLASGVYFYKIKAGSFEQTRRMLIIK